MKIYSKIIEQKDYPNSKEFIHTLEHQGMVDSLDLKVADLSRRRFTATTIFGRKIGVSLPRSAKLFDGAVLELSENYCLVVKVSAEKWLDLQPLSADVALKLGYFAGNLHWKVKFKAQVLSVAITQELDTYLSRINSVFSENELKILGSETEREHV